MVIRNTADNWTISNTVVILGNFDGIHNGHQLLVDTSLKIAEEMSLQTAVFTFLPHPSKFFGSQNFRLIYTEEEKQELFESCGLDYYILFPFNEENRNLSPEDFVDKILLKKLGAKAIVVGSDYRFGQKAMGNTETLKELLEPHGVKVKVLDKLQTNGEDISSTKLRKSIEEGDLQLFERLTGRKFHLNGIVISGHQLGRELGFPTANVLPDSEKLLPPNGVYLTNVIYNGNTHIALSNVGISPSLENRPYSVESYILDFNKDIYGEKISVEFVKFLRPEIKFSNVNDLKEQIGRDVALIRMALSLEEKM